MDGDDVITTEWTIDDRYLRKMLVKAAAGEDVDLILVELYANSTTDD